MRVTTWSRTASSGRLEGLRWYHIRSCSIVLLPLELVPRLLPFEGLFRYRYNCQQVSDLLPFEGLVWYLYNCRQVSDLLPFEGLVWYRFISRLREA
jgi:hypothetical protein